MPTKVYLSRRNLETLLKKLDRVKAGGSSACSIIKRDNKHPHYPQTMAEIYLVAVENEAYYTHRQPGAVAEDEDDKEYLNWLKNLE